MVWKIERDDQDTRLIDTEGNAFMILSDTPYYPVVNLADEEWALIAASPALLRAAEALMQHVEDWLVDAKGDEFGRSIRFGDLEEAIAMAKRPLPPFKT